MSEPIEIKESDFIDVDESTIKQITDVFGQLIKAVKAKLVYPSSSKLPQQFVDKLIDDFAMVLLDVPELKLKIESDSVLFGDLLIYKAKNKTENFAHPFFRDGIIELKFQSGLSSEEIDKFVDVISLVTRSANIEDDLATLLWEIGFENISYKLMDDSLDIETFEYGTAAIKTPIDNSGPEFNEIFMAENELELTDEDFDLDSDKNKSKKRLPGYKNVPDNVADYINRITEYDDSEKAAISEILKSEEEFEFKKYVIEILFEILGCENDIAGYNETLELISKVRDDFIRASDMKSAISIFKMTKELKEAFKNLGDEKEKKIKTFIASFGASERIRVLVEMLNGSKDINQNEVTEYLKMLSWEAIDPLIWALGELEQYHARRAICHALEIIAVDHVDILAKGTENPRWYVVRNVVMILGKIGSLQALSFFQRTITHSDLRVRKETVISAARIGIDKSADFLIMALNDDNEHLQALALKELVKQKVARALDPIEQMINNKNFKGRSTDQIKEILEGYAKLGGISAFDKLKKLATSLILIPSEKAERIRFYAIMALGYIKSPQAYQVLDKISKSRNKKKADAASRALSRRMREREIV